MLDTGAEDEVPYIQSVLTGEQGVFIAASDYMKALPLSIASWIPGPYIVLGTDGFGLSESREDLRAHFEVDAEHIAFAALVALGETGLVDQEELASAAQHLGIDPDKPDAAIAGPAQYDRS